MTADSPWIHELTWPAIDDYLKRDDIVLLPIGATEQHGPHTPLMVDTGWAIAVSEGAARRARVLTAPPLHVGWSPHHLSYPGGITLRPETLIQVVVDIGESLLVHGFKKIVIVNGNRIANLPPLEIAATKLRFRTGAYAAVVDVGLIARRELNEIMESGEGAQEHAGESETSYTLYAFEHLVDMGKVPPPRPRPAERRRFARNAMPVEPPFDENAVLVHPTAAEYRAATAPSGIGGDPSAATREKGKAIYEAIVGNFVAFIDEIRGLEVEVRDVEIPI